MTFAPNHSWFTNVLCSVHNKQCLEYYDNREGCLAFSCTCPLICFALTHAPGDYLYSYFSRFRKIIIIWMIGSCELVHLQYYHDGWNDLWNRTIDTILVKFRLASGETWHFSMFATYLHNGEYSKELFRMELSCTFCQSTARNRLEIPLHSRGSTNVFIAYKGDME